MTEYVGPIFNETHERPARDGDAVVVPAGICHNVINTSKAVALKLFTLYSPPNRRMEPCTR
jgi:mannose-6-phosphate isomerase-like protein (cupin superfamily)